MTAVLDEAGHTALTFAASENKLAACVALLDFVRNRQEELKSEFSKSSPSSNSNKDKPGITLNDDKEEESK